MRWNGGERGGQMSDGKRKGEEERGRGEGGKREEGRRKKRRQEKGGEEGRKEKSNERTQQHCQLYSWCLVCTYACILRTLGLLLLLSAGSSPSTVPWYTSSDTD